MRFLLVLIMFALSACGGPPEDNSSARSSSSVEPESTDDGYEDSPRTPMDKAQNVENVLLDSASSRDAAIEESSDGK